MDSIKWSMAITGIVLLIWQVGIIATIGIFLLLWANNIAKG